MLIRFFCFSMWLNLSLSAQAHATTVPEHIIECVKSQAQTVVEIQDRSTAWNRFQGYANRERIGLLAFRGHWKGFTTTEKAVAFEMFFNVLFENRRTPRDGSLTVTEVTVEGRDRPPHAHKDLIHVHVRVKFSDGDIKYLNLLGTRQCQLVDVAWGDVWLTPRLDMGLVERAALKRRNKS